jgi:hypothetical protein
MSIKDTAEHLEQLSLGYGLKPEYVQSLKLASQVFRIIYHNQKNNLGSEKLAFHIENMVSESLSLAK